MKVTTQELLASHYAEELEKLRAAVDAGNGMALLKAIESAAMSGAPLPGWLATATVKSIRKFTHHKASTLDAAFGVVRDASYRRRAAQDRWDKGPLIVADVLRFARQDVAIDDLLFEEVGAKYGVGKTTAKKWYYFHKDNNTLSYRIFLLEAKDLPDRD